MYFSSVLQTSMLIMSVCYGQMAVHLQNALTSGVSPLIIDVPSYVTIGDIKQQIYGFTQWSNTTCLQLVAGLIDLTTFDDTTQLSECGVSNDAVDGIIIAYHRQTVQIPVRAMIATQNGSIVNFEFVVNGSCPIIIGTDDFFRDLSEFVARETNSTHIDLPIIYSMNNGNSIVWRNKRIINFVIQTTHPHFVQSSTVDDSAISVRNGSYPAIDWFFAAITQECTLNNIVASKRPFYSKTINFHMDYSDNFIDNPDKRLVIQFHFNQSEYTLHFGKTI
eukprot:257087_1